MTEPDPAPVRAPSAARPLPPALLAVALLACSSMWGSSFVVMKGLVGTLSPLAIAALRGLTAAAALAAFFLATGRSLRPRRADLVPAVVMGTLQSWLPNALTAFAISGLGAGLAAMMQSSGPLMTAILAHFALSNEKLRGAQWLGVAIGFVGVATLIGPEALSGSSAAFWPAMAMLATAASYAIGNVWARTVRDVSAERLALGQQAFGGATACALAMLFDPAPGWAAAPSLWPQIATLGVAMSAFPVTLYMWLIQRAGPVKAVMTGYVTPLVAATLATTLLGETMAARQMLGAAIILSGVFLVTRR